MHKIKVYKYTFVLPLLGGTAHFDVIPECKHKNGDCSSFSRAYLDDIVIFGRSWEEHLIHLHEVLHSLKAAQLTINISKCQFSRSEVHYLGHVIGEEVVKPDPQKLDAVKNYPQPDSTKDVRTFLGLAGYYRRFVPHFAIP